MAPVSSPQRDPLFELANPAPGEEVVISGIAGTFPKSSSVAELRENLFAKMDLISEDGHRWYANDSEIPRRIGVTKNIFRFDADFFNIKPQEANLMDPAARILLEKSFEAIIDAGVNPNDLRGTRTGIFLTSGPSEVERLWLYSKPDTCGRGILGCSRALQASRIAYALDTHGPAYAVDTACSSSLYVLEQAYRHIRDGSCDAAIVGGYNFICHPFVSLSFAKLGVVSPEGKCKSFDKTADGYVRGENTVVVFLQKAKDSKRCYMQIQYAKTNADGFKPQGFAAPSSEAQMNFYKSFYGECGVPITDIEYMEAHGTGTKVGDPEELNAIDEFLCEPRSAPLLIGSIKSNLGHSEGGSGMNSIAKMCIAYNSGILPPNLHYTEPSLESPGLQAGHMTVVTEPLPWQRGLAAVNSFGIGGANCHVLLKRYSEQKIKACASSPSELPRLVCVSSRMPGGARRMLEHGVRAQKGGLYADHLALLHSAFARHIRGHVERGFGLFHPKESIFLEQESSQISKPNPPVCFLFGGMGSQWCGSSAKLIMIPSFAKAINRCQLALAGKNIDILEIISNTETKLLENVVHMFVGVVAMQIGICDVLKAVGIEPDYIIGYGMAELGCAYADGCLTAEQAIIAAYNISEVLQKTIFINSAIASIDVAFEKIKPSISTKIELLSVNGTNSCTVVGPAELIHDLLCNLGMQNIEGDTVTCCNIPFHSTYICYAKMKLLECLSDVITNPKARSSRWLSTSTTTTQQSSEAFKRSTAEYHVNNLLGPVFFNESLEEVPDYTVLIELSPSDMLHRILTEHSQRRNCTSIPLMRNRDEDALKTILFGLGKIYNEGLDMHLENLYPKVYYPVALETPMISHLIEWDHSHDYAVEIWTNEKRSGAHIIKALYHDDKDYMVGHVVDGRNLYPATGYLELAWLVFGKEVGVHYTNLDVVFTNVRFIRATHIAKGKPLEFSVMVQKGSGNFEIFEGGSVVVTGHLAQKETDSDDETVYPDIRKLPKKEKTWPVSKKDFYKELRLRGYNYKGQFRSILGTNIEGDKGEIRWGNNWVTFLDSMLQMAILQYDTRGLFVPTRIEKLTINTNKHYKIIDSSTYDRVDYSFDVEFNRELQTIRSEAVEIVGLHASEIAKRINFGVPVLETYKFVPHFGKSIIKVEELIRINIQLMLENVPSIKVKVVELADEETSTMLKEQQTVVECVRSVLEDLPLIQAELHVLSEEKLELSTGIIVEDKNMSDHKNSALLFVGTNLMERDEIRNKALETLKDKGFLLSRESQKPDLKKLANTFDVLTVRKTDSETLVLFRRRKVATSPEYITIKSMDDKFEWIEQVKSKLKEYTNVMLVSHNEDFSGLLGLVNCLTKEPGGELIRGMLIMDRHAPRFDPNDLFYKEQLDRNLVHNVYENGEWGSYRHLKLQSVTSVKADHAFNNATTRGDLTSLRWLEGPLQNKEEDQRNIIQIYYSALNFRDVMTATARISVETVAEGRLAQECVQGLEFSGRNLSGQRFMGMTISGGLANKIVAEEDMIWRVPDAWTLEQACTVPVVYSTVYYAFGMIGGITPDMSVLIHAGAGGVGQAAIHTCLHYGCTVFTTVGTDAKREFIREHFPQIKDCHIGNSRDVSFEEMIMMQTEGRGVSVVLNSLAEDKMKASLRCVARNGHFLEIGKFDFQNDSPLGLDIFEKGITFHSVMMDLLMKQTTSSEQKILHRELDEAIKSGAIKPLVSTVFGSDEVERAYRHMAGGLHVGKVLVKLRDEEDDRNAVPEPFLMDAVPRYMCDSNMSYVVVGGLGGFGLELVDRMIIRGARKLVLNSRKGISNGYQAMRLRVWKTYGADVRISKDDVSTEEGCVNILRIANAMAPVRGIFNLAVVLKDAIFENQTPETFLTSVKPKAIATIYLDLVSRKMCPQLKEFVVFSSVSCGRGNAGQSNYGLANAAMEHACVRRSLLGLPALAVQWGAVGQVGLVADMQEEERELEIGGTLQQSISSCLDVLDQLLTQDEPVVASMLVAEKRLGGSGTDNLAEAIASVMGIKDLKKISHNTTLVELGMDSMMAVEIKHKMEHEFDVFLSAQEIMTLTFARLVELSENNTDLPIDSPPADPQVNSMNIMAKNIPEECVACQDVIHMPSPRIHSQKNVDAVIDPQNWLYLVPGLDGFVGIFEPLVEKLQWNACGLQYGYRHFGEGIDGIAKRLTMEMKSHLRPGAPFQIIAHSFGAMVALEMTAALESEGHSGILICVDGAPDYLHMMTKISFGNLASDETRSRFLDHLILLSLPESNKNTKQLFTAAKTWEEKVKILDNLPANTFPGRPAEYLKSLTNVYYERIKAVLDFDAKQVRKVSSPIVLLRPKNMLLQVPIDEDYGLSKYCTSPVKVHLVDGNHFAMFESTECAEIVRETLNQFNMTTAKNNNSSIFNGNIKSIN